MNPTPKCCRCEFHPSHPEDCMTLRGRRLARICCECGCRFALYSSKSNRKRCPDCIEKRAILREDKVAKAQGYDNAFALRKALRAERTRKEAEIQHFAGMALEIRTAVSNQMFCVSCQSILDQSRAVLIRNTPHDEIICASCYDSSLTDAADVATVLDGRKIPAHVWHHSTSSLVGYAVLCAREEAR